MSSGKVVLVPVGGVVRPGLSTYGHPWRKRQREPCDRRCLFDGLVGEALAGVDAPEAGQAGAERSEVPDLAMGRSHGCRKSRLVLPLGV